MANTQIKDFTGDRSVDDPKSLVGVERFRLLFKQDAWEWDIVRSLSQLMRWEVLTLDVVSERKFIPMNFAKRFCMG